MEPLQANSDDEKRQNGNCGRKYFHNQNFEKKRKKQRNNGGRKYFEEDGSDLGRKYLIKYRDALVIYNDIIAECPNQRLTHEYITIIINWEMNDFIQYIKNKINKHNNIRKMMVLPVSIQIKQTMMWIQEELPKNKEEEQEHRFWHMFKQIKTTDWENLSILEKNNKFKQLYDEYDAGDND